MPEICPATGEECSILTAILDNRRAASEEFGLEAREVSEIYGRNYDKLLKEMLTTHCTDKMCGFTTLGAVTLEALAITDTEEEIENMRRRSIKRT